MTVRSKASTIETTDMFTDCQCYGSVSFQGGTCGPTPAPTAVPTPVPTETAVIGGAGRASARSAVVVVLAAQLALLVPD